MQTWLVHMRQPQKFIQMTGWRGLLAVQLFVAGNFLSAIINPILWATTLTWLIAKPAFISSVFPGILLELNIFALIIGNLFFVFLAVIAPLKRGWFNLSIYGLTTPFYWVLSSVAAYKALWQIIFKPFYWEKTDHVISEIAKEKRRNALYSLKRTAP